MGYQGFVVVVLLLLFFPSHILGKERVNSFYSTIELNISRELCLVFQTFAQLDVCGLSTVGDQMRLKELVSEVPSVSVDADGGRRNTNHLSP